MHLNVAYPRDMLEEFSSSGSCSHGEKVTSWDINYLPFQSVHVSNVGVPPGGSRRET